MISNSKTNSGVQVQDHIEEGAEQVQEIKQLPKRGKHVKKFEGILRLRQLPSQSKQQISKKISIKANINKSIQKIKSCIKKTEDNTTKKSQASFPNVKSIKFSPAIKDVFTYAVEDKLSLNIKTKRLRHMLQNTQVQRAKDKQPYIQREKQSSKTREDKEKKDERCQVM